MSVADRLGTGSSFGGVPRGRSARGRAKALVQGDVPAYELARIRLEEVAPTPLNPRRNFGTDEEMTRFGEELRNTQLAACVAISRAAYLKVWPQHEAAIGDAQYVLINGERRYRCASHVGLEALDFVVRDDLASSREAFIDHLLKENLEREDFDVVERARGVQQLVLVCSEESATGARARAAKRLGRDRSWVTNQLALLELPEELQLMLSAGTLAERDGRMLARKLKDEPGLDAAALLDHLKEQREKEARTREETRALAEQVRQRQQAEEGAAGGGQVLSADNTLRAGQPSAVPSPQASVPAPAQPPASEAPHEAPPAPRAAGPAAVTEGTAASGPVSGAAPASESVPMSEPAPAPGTGPAPGAGLHPLPAVVPVPVAVPPLAERESTSELLSADNNSAGAAAVGSTESTASDSAERVTDTSARSLVRKLGATPEAQARTLAAGLAHDELVALVKELHDHM
ncbi:ParB/RepB/Spo0J family partition protein (plasmid) [Streptomyces sp. CA-294286]|uniref:ParB/RepB/Spo0J family partition protein n=1 Tax=Streptomyces sp. CA-294286 TaxID=3240070 RepID=UPI003D8DD008